MLARCSWQFRQGRAVSIYSVTEEGRHYCVISDEQDIDRLKRLMMITFATAVTQRATVWL